MSYLTHRYTKKEKRTIVVQKIGLHNHVKSKVLTNSGGWRMDDLKVQRVAGYARISVTPGKCRPIPAIPIIELISLIIFQ